MAGNLCGAKRGVADVSADANPETGAAVYDSTEYEGESGWFQVGGTSLSSPIIASVYALAGNAASVEYPASLPYASVAGLHDVTTGPATGKCLLACRPSKGLRHTHGPGLADRHRGLLVLGASVGHAGKRRALREAAGSVR